MGYALSEIEVNGTVEVTDGSRFDLPTYAEGQKILVQRIRFTAQGGSIVEIEANGPLYRKDGTVSRNVRRSLIAPPDEENLDDQYDALWSEVPVRLQQIMLDAVKVSA